MTIHEKLIAAGVKYRKELLVAPMVAFATIAPFFTTMTNVQGKTMAGSLNTTSEFRPYATTKGATDTAAIKPREMENFLGDLVEEFDPRIIMGSLYSEATSTNADKFDISAKVALVVAKRAGEKLVKNIFTAVRDNAGTTSADLFNGFDTLTAAGVTDTSISVANKNYVDITSTPITRANCGDVLKARFRALDSNLKDGCKLYLPVSIMDHYEDWYQDEHGHAPFNTTMTQKFLAGSNNKCELYPLSMMEGGDYLYFTKKENMILLFDQTSDAESVEIRRCDNPKVVQLFMVTYFGVGIDTVDKEFFTAVKYSAEEPAALAISSVAKTNETAAAEDDGTITITATGGVGATEYSIDNGVSWRDSNVFEGLTHASYVVKVRDVERNVVTYATNPVVISAGA
jgi:hypothetical protein